MNALNEYLETISEKRVAPTVDRDDSSAHETIGFYPDQMNRSMPFEKFKKRALWIGWREETRRGRKTKVPVSVRAGICGSSTNPDTWGSLSRAKRCAGGKIGIILGRHDDGLHLAGIDIDNCRDPETGILTAEAKGVLTEIPTYAEVSPSGTGIKLFFETDPKDAKRIDALLDGKSRKSFSRGEHEEIALDVAARFYAVTGEAYDRTPVERIRFAELEWLITEAGPEYQGKPRDHSRSGRAFRLASRLKRQGKDFSDFEAELAKDAELAEWAKDARQVQRAWDRTDSLQRTKQGEPLSNLANAITLITDYDEIGYDEMSGRLVFKRDRREVTDEDVTRLTERLQRDGLKSIAITNVYAAVAAVAKANGFHPIRDHLRSLTWDRKSRLTSWLSEYMGAPDTPYTSTIGRLIILQMVARVMEPGCKADHMPVFEGKQGIGKSTACRILAGNAYFSDSMPSIDREKDAMSHLRGMWVVEWSELASFRKSAREDIKKFLSKTTDRFRPAYGRSEIEVPRQCIFIGTTNESEYLKDSTGDRRFWPITCGDIATKALERDRNQLFAEAVVAYDEREPWWPDQEFERRFVQPEQAARYEEDPWAKQVGDYLEGKSRVTASEVASLALQLPASQATQLVKRRITDIIRTLAWESTKSNGQRIWVPVRKRKGRNRVGGVTSE